MNVTNTNWTNVINSMLQSGEIEGADKIQATAVQDANGDLVVSFKGADGQTYSFTTSLPELDEATGEPTPETLATLEAKLEGEVEIMEKQLEEARQLLEENGVDETSTGPQKLLFDIYALMNLMLEIAQKQREAARNERKADLDRAVQDIKNQADIQRNAAMLSMVLGICTTLVSVALQSAMTGASAKAQRTAMQMENNAGATQIRADLNLLTAESPTAASKNLTEVETNIGKGSTELQTIQENNSDMMNKASALNGPRSAYENAVSARDAYLQETADLQNSDGGLEGAINAQQKTCDQCKTDVDKLEQEFNAAADGSDAKINLGKDLDKAKADLKTAEDDLTALKNRKSENDPTLAGLNKTVNDTKTTLETAQNEFAKEADISLTKVDGKLAKARSELHELEAAEPKDEAAIQKKQAEIGKLEQEHTWIRAYATSTKMTNGMHASIADDIKNSETVLGQKMEALKLDAKYRQCQSEAEQFMGLRGLVDQLGQMCSNVAHQAGEMMSAGATEEQAAAKTHENMQAESDDLAQSAKQLLEAVLDLLRQVISAENQSIRQIVA